MTKPPAASQREAPAKINLFLEVIAKRPDGFHDIDSVFAEVTLADAVTAEATNDARIRLDVVGLPDIPSDSRNLAYKAVDLLRQRTRIETGLRLTLTKRIPPGGGLGGGSSDAAAALRLANDCLNAGLTLDELHAIGAEIGSDVPFFFYGGVCVCTGRGERVKPVLDFPANVGLTLVLTGVHCDTAAAYRGIRLPGPGEARRSEDFLSAFQTGDVQAMERMAFNRFEPTIFAAYPELGKMHRDLSETLNRPVRLSGSGGSLWYFSYEGDENNPILRQWANENAVTLHFLKIRSI